MLRDHFAIDRGPRSGYVPSPVRVRSAHLLEDRPWSVDETTGCWNWLGATLNGYGTCGAGRAHRIVWALSGGEPIDGYDLHHGCRNSLCVNPEHMEPIGRVSHLKRHKQADSPLTIEDVVAIRSAEGTSDEVAEQFGTKPCTVRAIWAREYTWDEAGPSMRPERYCLECGGRITTGRRDKVYCSKACRLTHGSRAQWQRQKAANRARRTAA